MKGVVFFLLPYLCLSIIPPWLKGERVPAGTNVQLTVGLKQQNIGQLKKFVDEVSDPRNAKYGKYYTLEELTNLVAPPASHISTVVSWFKTNGATVAKPTRSKDFLDVEIPSGKLEEALGIQMYTWRHPASKREIYRADTQSYTFPSEVAPFIDLVTGIHDFFTYYSERKQLRDIQNQPYSSAVNNSAPSIHVCRGSERTLAVEFTPYCKNGSPSMNLQCGTYSIVSVQVTTLKRPAEMRTITVPEKDITCHGTSCFTRSFDIEPYRRLNVSMIAMYSTGDKSLSATYFPFFQPVPEVTPMTVKQRYNIPLNMKGTNASNSMAVGEFEQQYVSLEDLKTFQREMGLDQQMPHIHGMNNQSMPGGESTLDIQYLMGVAPGVPAYFWSVSGHPKTGGYILEWAKQVAATPKAPLVTSLSYGDTEMAFYHAFGGWQYVIRMEAELAKMASRGLTVVASAGDAGCTNVGFPNNDLHGADATCTPFRPVYPTSSPYVTSVSASFETINSLPICTTGIFGSDSIPDVCNNPGEVAVSLSTGAYWTTGGGFSNLTKVTNNVIPHWQVKPVAHWKKWATTPGTGGRLPPSSVWNSKGRAYPDVTTLGLNLLMVWNAVNYPVSGTSASSPIWAALVALLNENRISAGKAPLGLMNPFLYQTWEEVAGSFNDITVGYNGDALVQDKGSIWPSACPYGFQAAPEWDPITGLGSPDWGKLNEAAMSLP